MHESKQTAAYDSSSNKELPMWFKVESEPKIVILQQQAVGGEAKTDRVEIG